MNAQESSLVLLRPVPWKRYLAVLLVVGIGVACSLTIFFLVRYWEFRVVKTAFGNAAADRSSAVKRAFETRLTMLELIRPTLIRAVPVDHREDHEIRRAERCRWIGAVP